MRPAAESAVHERGLLAKISEITAENPGFAVVCYVLSP